MGLFGRLCGFLCVLTYLKTSYYKKAGWTQGRGLTGGRGGLPGVCVPMGCGPEKVLCLQWPPWKRGVFPVPPADTWPSLVCCLHRVPVGLGTSGRLLGSSEAGCTFCIHEQLRPSCVQRESPSCRPAPNLGTPQWRGQSQRTGLRPLCVDPSDHVRGLTGWAAPSSQRGSVSAKPTSALASRYENTGNKGSTSKCKTS